MDPPPTPWRQRPTRHSDWRPIHPLPWQAQDAREQQLADRLSARAAEFQKVSIHAREIRRYAEEGKAAALEAARCAAPHVYYICLYIFFRFYKFPQQSGGLLFLFVLHGVTVCECPFRVCAACFHFEKKANSFSVCINFYIFFSFLPAAKLVDQSFFPTLLCADFHLLSKMLVWQMVLTLLFIGRYCGVLDDFFFALTASILP